MTPKQKLDHYRTYLKIYGWMIMSLAESDDEILKFISSDHSGNLMLALREHVEKSPAFEAP